VKGNATVTGNIIVGPGRSLPFTWSVSGALTYKVVLAGGAQWVESGVGFAVARGTFTVTAP